MSPLDALLPYAHALAALPCPWFVAGGWAIDLYLGRVTREHADVDVAVYRRDQAAVRRHLETEGWVLRKVVARQLEPWAGGEWLSLPVHEVHAAREQGEPARLEVLLNEGDDQLWRFRRRPEITRPRAQVELRSPEGLPFLAPEVVLLFKASGTRPADDADFEACRGALDSERRAWLRAALAAMDAGHRWLRLL
jgi:hypothetical protein